MAAGIKDHSLILIVHTNLDSSDDISNFNGFLTCLGSFASLDIVFALIKSTHPTAYASDFFLFLFLRTIHQVRK